MKNAKALLIIAVIVFTGFTTKEKDIHKELLMKCYESGYLRARNLSIQGFDFKMFPQMYQHDSTEFAKIIYE